MTPNYSASQSQLDSSNQHKSVKLNETILPSLCSLPGFHQYNEGLVLQVWRIWGYFRVPQSTDCGGYPNAEWIIMEYYGLVRVWREGLNFGSMSGLKIRPKSQELATFNPYVLNLTQSPHKQGTGTRIHAAETSKILFAECIHHRFEFHFELCF